MYTLTPEEKALLKYLETVAYSLGQLGINPIQFHLSVNLIRATQPVSENALAQALGRPRTTIRKYVQSAVARGHLERTPTGLQYTPEGKKRAIRFFREIKDVSDGKRAWFSSEFTKKGVENRHP